MVHNGIEYGIMASYAEGLNILRNAERRHAAAQAEDAETAPLREPQYYQYDLDIPERRRGVAARERGRQSGCSTSPPTRCRRNGDLSDFAGRVSDSR